MRRYPLILIAALGGCGQHTLCSSEVVGVTHDPGGGRYAATESRSCGASTDVATVVRVGRAGEARGEAQEVFVADAGRDHSGGSGKGGTIWTNVVWTGPGRLQIARASHARVFKQLAASNGAAITYRATDPIPLQPVP